MNIDYKPDAPSVCEVAVEAGHVIINYQSLVGAGQWGHLSFTPEQTDSLIATLQKARGQAAKSRN